MSIVFKAILAEDSYTLRKKRLRKKQFNRLKNNEPLL